jgi:hypothetical protein
MNALSQFFNFAKYNLVAILFLVAISVTVIQNNTKKNGKKTGGGSSSGEEEGEYTPPNPSIPDP